MKISRQYCYIIPQLSNSVYNTVISVQFDFTQIQFEYWRK